jgi:hypothetical protein
MCSRDWNYTPGDLMLSHSIQRPQGQAADAIIIVSIVVTTTTVTLLISQSTYWDKSIRD